MSRLDPTAGLSRRRLLSCLPVLAVGGAVAARATPAQALSIEPADASTANLIANHCSTAHVGLHQELVAELRSQLAARGVTIDAATVAADLRRATCPLCGCPLVLADQALPDPSVDAGHAPQ